MGSERALHENRIKGVGYPYPYPYPYPHLAITCYLPRLLFHVDRICIGSYKVRVWTDASQTKTFLRTLISKTWLPTRTPLKNEDSLLNEDSLFAPAFGAFLSFFLLFFPPSSSESSAGCEWRGEKGVYLRN